MSVDLPDPLGPMTATSSPASMVRSTPRRAGTSTSPRRYTLVTPARRMRGAPAASEAATAHPSAGAARGHGVRRGRRARRGARARGVHDHLLALLQARQELGVHAIG